MYYHQRLAANQCKLAFHGMGDYKVKAEYAHLVQPIGSYAGHAIRTVQTMTNNIREMQRLPNLADPIKAEEEANRLRPAIEVLAQKDLSKK